MVGPVSEAVIIIIEDIVEVRSEYCHVLGCVGCHGSVWLLFRLVTQRTKARPFRRAAGGGAGRGRVLSFESEENRVSIETPGCIVVAISTILPLLLLRGGGGEDDIIGQKDSGDISRRRSNPRPHRSS